MKLGRGISCVQSQAMKDLNNDCKPPLLKEHSLRNEKDAKHDIHTDTEDYVTEEEEQGIWDSCQPQRIRRRISFSGFSGNESERLKHIAEGRSLTTVQPASVVTELRRGRCHSFAGVKNKKLVEITRGPHETAVVDGFLTTTFCSTDL